MGVTDVINSCSTDDELYHPAEDSTQQEFCSSFGSSSCDLKGEENPGNHALSRRNSREKRDESPRLEGWTERSNAKTAISLGTLDIPELEASFPLISIMGKTEEKTIDQEISKMEIQFSPNIPFAVSCPSSTFLESTSSLLQSFAQWETDQGAGLPLSPLLSQTPAVHEPFRKRHFSEDFKQPVTTEDDFSSLSHSCPSPNKFFGIWSNTQSSSQFAAEPVRHSFPQCCPQLSSHSAKLSSDFSDSRAFQQKDSFSPQLFTDVPPILTLLSAPPGDGKEATSRITPVKRETETDFFATRITPKRETETFFPQFDLPKQEEREEQFSEVSDFRNTFSVSDNSIPSFAGLDESFLNDDFGSFGTNSAENLDGGGLQQHQRGYRESDIPQASSIQVSIQTQLNNNQNQRRFTCELCGKHFTQKGGLLNHSRIHTGARPFKCQECGRGFTQKCNLTRHNRIHTGEKPFECHLCYRRFNRKWGLVVHLRAHQNSASK